MKATGIIRRIDDLGRIVIPKEIRRTLRIREGDPLELYTSSQGEVIFKKYSPMGECEGIVKSMLDTLKEYDIRGAIYDNSDYCMYKTAKDMPETNEYDALNKFHYAIKIDGDHWGHFVATEELNDTQKDIINALFKMFAKINAAV